jgi:hypothetical protein
MKIPFFAKNLSGLIFSRLIVITNFHGNSEERWTVVTLNGQERLKRSRSRFKNERNTVLFFYKIFKIKQGIKQIPNDFF